MRGQSATRHAEDVADSEKVTAEEYVDVDVEEDAVAVVCVAEDFTSDSDDDAVDVNLPL